MAHGSSASAGQPIESLCGRFGRLGVPVADSKLVLRFVKATSNPGTSASALTLEGKQRSPGALRMVPSPLSRLRSTKLCMEEAVAASEAWDNCGPGWNCARSSEVVPFWMPFWTKLFASTRPICKLRDSGCKTNEAQTPPHETQPWSRKHRWLVGRCERSWARAPAPASSWANSP